jgi:hypothetical protein
MSRAQTGREDFAKPRMSEMSITMSYVLNVRYFLSVLNVRSRKLLPHIELRADLALWPFSSGRAPDTGDIKVPPDQWTFSVTQRSASSYTAGASASRLTMVTSSTTRGGWRAQVHPSA